MNLSIFFSNSSIIWRLLVINITLTKPKPCDYYYNYYINNNYNNNNHYSTPWTTHTLYNELIIIKLMIIVFNCCTNVIRCVVVSYFLFIFSMFFKYWESLQTCTHTDLSKQISRKYKWKSSWEPQNSLAILIWAMFVFPNLSRACVCVCVFCWEPVWDGRIKFMVEIIFMLTWTYRSIENSLFSCYVIIWGKKTDGLIYAKNLISELGWSPS